MKLVNHIDDTTAWINIVGHCIIGKPFSNPMRKDINPSAVLFISKNNNILLHDFVEGTFTWKSFLKHYSNYNQYDIDKFINNNQYNFKIKYKKTEKKINYLLKSWSKSDDDYWNKYNITQHICKLFEVYPVNYTWINKVICHTYTEKSPVYIYKLDNFIKIYAPYHKIKWLTNCSNELWQGYNQLPWLGENLIITKSLKDVMCLYSFGYTAVAPHSESMKFDENFIDLLYKRFENIYLLYDNDEAGKKAMSKIKNEYKLIKIIELTDSKDISDYYEKFGYDKTKNYLNGIYKI